MKRLTKLLLGPMARAGRPYLESLGLLRTNSLFATSTVVWQPPAARVLVLAPHMDDETIGCGGAVALHVRAGGTAKVVFFTDGRYGDPKLAEMPAEARRSRERELVAAREQEARQALEVLGVTDARFFGGLDGSLGSTPGIVEKLRRLIDEVQPEYLYLPFFVDQHPDHRAVSRLLRDAVSDGNYDFMCVAYEVWAPLWPNCLVEIDAVLDLKRSALQQYRSQIEGCDYLHHSLGLNAFRAAPLNGGATRYAEAFCMLPLRKYLDLLQRAAGPRA